MAILLPRRQLSCACRRWPARSCSQQAQAPRAAPCAPSRRSRPHDGQRRHRFAAAAIRRPGTASRPRAPGTGHVAHGVQRAARGVDVHRRAPGRPAAISRGVAMFSALSSGVEQLVQAVARQVDREDQQSQRAARVWRSARTRRTYRPWLRRSSGPTRTACGGCTPRPRKDSARFQQDGAGGASSVAMTAIRCGNDAWAALRRARCARWRPRPPAPRRRIPARAPAAWRCA